MIMKFMVIIIFSIEFDMSFAVKGILVDHNIGGWKTQELERDL